MILRQYSIVIAEHSLVSGGVGRVGQALDAVVDALRPLALAPDVALHACQPVLQLRLPLQPPDRI